MPDDFIITEGVAGVWTYHWSKADSWTRGLCGAQTMRTELKPDAWGQQGHLGERYCRRCAERKAAACA
jgi:hypothetical protein